MGRQAAVLISICLAAPAAAEDWRPLTGEALADALTGQTLIYDPDEQIFFENGRTRYRVFRDRWGWWELREGRYCSLWPPAEIWDCYDTEITPDGTRLRFTSAEGIVTEGRFAE
ncbi:hypothetical protein [Ovoidimarina sediminis]|uniref:hypothetical protein n=1 Tax=Ovoidimarina sediminis TaxID=3079856 RepID=UPI00292E6C6E|nr:hypothetical protein [Rhodophyticola sp. MJ-SS7]